MSKAKILIVDDEKNIRRSVQMICTSEGYEAETAEDAEAALKFLQDKSVDIALLDIVMPGMDGLTLLREVRKTAPQTAVVMISGNATIRDAVTATREGAYDFIEKPITKERLLLALKNALATRNLVAENTELKKQIAGNFEMIGDSRAMRDIIDQISRVAPTKGRVLITGESGTGKELIARAIHDNSPRREGAFVKVNCAAIPEELIESELFGSVKGAFTGATEDREGKFAQADGGTLFLDEIGDMSLKVQAKVLRVLQEGEFEKVGGQKTLKVDVRVLAATNKNLEEEVKQGRFRDDLLFRLNVVPLDSPPLRRRKEDIPMLVHHFMRIYADESGQRPKEVSEAAMSALKTYDWPGNIRELRNIIERLMIMCRGDIIDVPDLPQQIHSSTMDVPFSLEPGLTLKDLRDSVEREYIRAALERNDGNISQTARELDVDRTNLHKKIKALGLSGE